MTQTDDRGREMTDDEIIAEERRRSKRAFIAALALALAAFATAISAEFLIRAGILQALGIPRSADDTVLFWLLIALISIVVPFAVWHYRPPKAAMSERILRKQIDVHHRRWRWIMLMIVPILPLMTFNMTYRPPHTSSYTWFSPAALVFVAVIFAVVVCFGPGALRKTYRTVLNDEWTRSLRLRAARTGYLALMIMLGGAYLAILHRPALAAVILPWLMAAGVCIPIAYFLILEWRADRDNS